MDELSDDLEWLLASGQAKDEQLALALVDAFYPRIYRLVLALNHDPRAARRATQETITAAILNAYRFTGNQTATSWLAGLAIPIIEASQGQTLPPAKPAANQDGAQAQLTYAFDQLSPLLRRSAAMHYLLGLPVEAIADLLKAEKAEVETNLDFTQKQLALALWGMVKPDGKSQAAIKTEIVRGMEKAWPLPVLNEADINAISQKIVRRVKKQRGQAQRSNAFKEILAVGVTFILVGVLVWRTEILKPEQKPTATPQPSRAVVVQVQITPTPKVVTNTPDIRSYKLPSPNFPTPTPEPTSTPFPMDAIYRVRDGDTLKSIASALGVSVAELAQYNRILPEQTLEQYQVLVIPGRIRPQPLPLLPEETPSPTKEPLTVHSTIEEVMQQPNGMFDFYQNQGKIWLDQVVHIYGPQAYRGPEQTYRSQVWIGNGVFLMVSGREDSIPAEVLMMVAHPDDSGGMYISRPASAMQHGEPAWFMDVDHIPEDEFYLASGYLMQYLYSMQMIFGQRMDLQNGVGKTTITGSEKFRGRQVLVMEQQGNGAELLQRGWIDAQRAWIDAQRAWIDAKTGLFLLEQAYGNDGQTILWEVTPRNIADDFALNQSLFDPHLPWRGSYAANVDGDPTLFDVQEAMATPAPAIVRPQPKPTPPADFNPGRASLTFRTKTGFNFFDPQMAQAGVPVDLYADDIYLTSLMIGDPSSSICARSPDGNILALQSITLPFYTQAGNLPTLKLIDLRGVGSPDIRDVGLHAQRMAFSPDGSKLAILGRRDYGTGVFLWDLQDYSSKLLTGIDTARALTWSPDGKYLALIHEPDTPVLGEAIVIQVESPMGKRVFQGSLGSLDKDEEGNYLLKLATESMPEGWEIHFKNNPVDLDSCARPPGK